MKIFSLQSKTGLVIWSVILGILIYTVGSFTYFGRELNCGDSINSQICYEGLGFGAKIFGFSIWGLPFWIVASVVILAIYKFLKIKND